MSIKDMIHSALSKDASEFEKAFDSVMAGKVETAVAAKYDSMYSGSVEDQVAEAPAEVEASAEVDSEVE